MDSICKPMASRFCESEAHSRHRVVQRLLKALCDKFGFRDIAYCADFSQARPDVLQRLGQDAHIKCLRNRKHIYFSSRDLAKYYESWSRNGLKRDNNIRRLMSSHQMLWEYGNSRNSETNSSLVNMLSYGYRNKVSLTVRVGEGSEYLGRFSIFVDDYRLVEFLMASPDELRRELEYIHLFCMHQYGSVINPMVDLQIIKQKSLMVLSRLKDGCLRSSIAKECHITERGVDYHIDSLKAQLQVNNMAQLISVAKDKYLI